MLGFLKIQQGCQCDHSILGTRRAVGAKDREWGGGALRSQKTSKAIVKTLAFRFSGCAGGSLCCAKSSKFHTAQGLEGQREDAGSPESRDMDFQHDRMKNSMNVLSGKTDGHCKQSKTTEHNSNYWSRNVEQEKRVHIKELCA